MVSIYCTAFVSLTNGNEYLRAIYVEVGHVYAPFMPNWLHCHHRLIARFTHSMTATSQECVRARVHN